MANRSTSPILNPNLTRPLQEHIDSIATALSRHLTDIATHLAQIAQPGTVPISSRPPLQTNRHDPAPTQPAANNPITALPATIRAQHADLAAQRADARALRVEVAEQATAVLDAQRSLVAAVVRVLEQSMHGAAARGARARAEHLAVVAQGMALKVR
jgi:diphthamide biosynthesis protein 3